MFVGSGDEADAKTGRTNNRRNRISPSKVPGVARQANPAILLKMVFLCVLFLGPAGFPDIAQKEIPVTEAEVVEVTKGAYALASLLKRLLMSRHRRSNAHSSK